MRAQTTLDFAIGVVIFIVTVAFVASFIPATFQPFSEASQDHTILADRVATQLSTSALASPAEPYVLDQACTTAFFAGTSPPSRCGYPDAPLTEQIGVAPDQSLQLILRRDNNHDGNANPLCEATNGDIIEEGSGTCTTIYAVGDEPGGQTVTVARRTVWIDGLDSRLEVRIW